MNVNFKKVYAQIEPNVSSQKKMFNMILQKKKNSLGVIMFALSGDAGPLKCERMQTGERYGGSY